MTDIIALLTANPTLALALTAIFGLLIGSFLNVVISRYPEMLYREWRTECHSFLKLDTPTESTSRFNLAVPRSRCPKCQSLIKSWQNIPIISYVLLRGKCANCRTPISVLYPIVEALTALLCVSVVWHFGLTLQSLFAVIFTVLLIAMSFIDLKEQIIPDLMNYLLLWIGLFANIFTVFVPLQSAVIGALVGYLSLWGFAKLFLLIRKKEGMGHGDFKLFAALGAWMGATMLLNILLIAAISGVVFGVVAIIRQQLGKDTPFAFGPYLAIGGWASLIFGPFILHFINRIMA